MACCTGGIHISSSSTQNLERHTATPNTTTAPSTTLNIALLEWQHSSRFFWLQRSSLPWFFIGPYFRTQHFTVLISSNSTNVQVMPLRLSWKKKPKNQRPRWMMSTLLALALFSPLWSLDIVNISATGSNTDGGKGHSYEQKMIGGFKSFSSTLNANPNIFGSLTKRLWGWVEVEITYLQCVWRKIPYCFVSLFVVFIWPFASCNRKNVGPQKGLTKVKLVLIAIAFMWLGKERCKQMEEEIQPKQTMVNCGNCGNCETTYIIFILCVSLWWLFSLHGFGWRGKCF